MGFRTEALRSPESQCGVRTELRSLTGFPTFTPPRNPSDFNIRMGFPGFLAVKAVKPGRGKFFPLYSLCDFSLCLSLRTSLPTPTPMSGAGRADILAVRDYSGYNQDVGFYTPPRHRRRIDQELVAAATGSYPAAVRLATRAASGAAHWVRRKYATSRATNRGIRGGHGTSYERDAGLVPSSTGSRLAGAEPRQLGSRGGPSRPGMPANARSRGSRRRPVRGRRRNSRGRRRSFRSYSKRKPVGFKGSVRKRVMTRSKRFKPTLKVSKRFRKSVKHVIATSSPQVVKFMQMGQTASTLPNLPKALAIGSSVACFQPKRPDSMMYPAGSDSAFITGSARRSQTATRGMMWFPFNHVRRATTTTQMALATDAGDPIAYFRGNYYHPTYCAVRCGWLPGEKLGFPGKTSIPSVSRVEHGFGYITSWKKLESVCTALFGGLTEATMRQALFTYLGTKGKRDQLCMISGTGWTQKSIDLPKIIDATSTELSYRNIKALHSCFRITKRIYNEIRPQVKQSAGAAGGVASVASGLRGEGVMFGKTKYNFKLPSKHVIRDKCNDGSLVGQGHLSVGNPVDGIPASPFVPENTPFQYPLQRGWIPFIFARGDSENARVDGDFSATVHQYQVAGDGADTCDLLPAFYCDYKVGIRDEMEE